MAIPDLDKHGLLPAGIHSATLDEVQAAFAEAEDKNRRAHIWDGFINYVELLGNFDVISTIYLDGSFMTSKEKPNDIDIIVELPSPEEFHALVEDPRGKELLTAPEMKRRFHTDPWPHFPGIPPRFNTLELFQRLRNNLAHDLGIGPTHRKGIIKVAI